MSLVKFGMQVGKSTARGAETGNFENLSKLREKHLQFRMKTTEVLPFPSRWSLCEKGEAAQREIGALEEHMGRKPQGSGEGRIKQREGRQCSGYVHNIKKGECSYKKQIDLDFENCRERGKKKESLVLQTHLLAPADMRKTEILLQNHQCCI